MGGRNFTAARVSTVPVGLKTRRCRWPTWLRASRFVVTLVLLERLARIEQPTEQLLLSRDGRAVEATVVERFGELPRFLCELRSAVTAGGITCLVELFGELPLLLRQRPRERLALLAVLRVGHAHETLRLTVDLSLLLRHLLHLLAASR